MSPQAFGQPEPNPDHQIGLAKRESRRHRISHSRLVMPLPPFDIRVRRELAHRRTLVSIFRHFQRIVLLHILDAAAAFLAGVAALRVDGESAGKEMLPLLIGLVLVGLEGRRAYQSAHGRRDPWRVITGVMLAFAAAALMSVLPPFSEIPLRFVTSFSVLTTIAVLIERATVDAIVRQLYVHGVGLRRA